MWRLQKSSETATNVYNTTFVAFLVYPNLCLFIFHEHEYLFYRSILYQIYCKLISSTQIVFWHYLHFLLLWIQLYTLEAYIPFNLLKCSICFLHFLFMWEEDSFPVRRNWVISSPVHQEKPSNNIDIGIVLLGFVSLLIYESYHQRGINYIFIQINCRGARRWKGSFYPCWLP